MLQLVDVVKDNLLKENMQLEVLYTIAKKADCPVNYLRLDVEKDVIDAEFGKCANFFCLYFDENILYSTSQAVFLIYVREYNDYLHLCRA
mgnify:CR=1 FL=1